jgi:hypothetical protein
MSMPQSRDLRTRREALQRVQIGIVGFAVVLLIVTIANLVVQAVRPDPNLTASSAATTQSNAGVSNSIPLPILPDSEPLSDLGVMPKSDASASPASSSVPDLEPDRRLSKPMDQDPKAAGQSQ